MNNHGLKYVHLLFIISILLASFHSSTSRSILTLTATKSDTESIDIVEDPTCPCLREHVHDLSPTGGNESCIDLRFQQHDGTFKFFCYPRSYGVTCKKHDAGLPPFCADPDNGPEFCNTAFCYVDPTICKNSLNNTYTRSKYFPHLFFSYDTCGYENTWEDVSTINQLKGRTLRVGIPAILFPDHYKDDENGKAIRWDRNVSVGVGDWKGLYVDYINGIASLGLFNVEYMAVSEGAIAQQSPSQWDACVLDVGRGLLDMCVGNFWETSKRRQVAQTSTSLFNDLHYMVTLLPKNDNRLPAQMQKLFEPFTVGLWTLIILVTLSVGITYTLLGSNRRTSFHDFRHSIIETIYTAYLEIMLGADSRRKTIPQRFVTVSWAFFILIVLAAYTANLAAFLGKDKKIYKVKSVRDCIEINCLSCILDQQVLHSELERLYPQLRIDSSFQFPEELTTALEEGTCDIAIVSKFDYDLQPGYWGDCQITFLGNFLTVFKAMWPVSPAISIPISYWLSKTTDSGFFDKVIRDYQPPPLCDKAVEEVHSNHSEQIGVVAMSGPILILAAGICFAFLVKFENVVEKKTSNRQKKSRPRSYTD